MTEQIQIPDLAYERVSPDMINLEQSIGCGEMTIVSLHRIHVEWLVKEMGVQRSPPVDAALRYECEMLRRRIHDLHEKAADLYLDEGLIDPIFDRCGDAAEIVSYIRRIYEASIVAIDDIAALNALREEASLAGNPPETQQIPIGLPLGSEPKKPRMSQGSRSPEAKSEESQSGHQQTAPLFGLDGVGLPANGQ